MPSAHSKMSRNLSVISKPKAEKGNISLGMSKRMSKRIYNERWVREKFSTNEELHNPTPIPRISF